VAPAESASRVPGLAEHDDAPPLKIVLADDHGVVRAGVRMLLEAEPGWQVVAECADTDCVAAAVREHEPAVLVLDLLMPGRPAMELLAELRETAPATRIVMLTMSDDPVIARAAMEAGCAAFVLKDSSGGELVEAVRRAIAGHHYLDPTIGALVASARPRAASSRLTDRELDVLRLIALGNTNGEIAEALSLSVRTVETHRSRILAKTDAKTRAELVSYALGAGLLDAQIRAQRSLAIHRDNEV
jgi:two-component system, NarL family, response regulator NreC